MSGEPLIVAIDGPAGAGKSTVARKVAESLGISYLDTGALYRAIALALDERRIAPAEGPDLNRALDEISIDIDGGDVYINGKSAGVEIRTPRADALVSSYASLPAVRRRLLSLQREQGRKRPVVADGRDMATVVFPGAPVKIFLTATDEERARRRFKELKERNEPVSFEKVLEQIRERDKADSGREIAPLKMAADAVEVVTDGLSIEEVAQVILSLVGRASNEGAES
ncbi:MAG: (d)CMP kinase [Synergistaceae bacterium]|nr:(d)CMP kinase [Synergistaceae bacterium]